MNVTKAKQQGFDRSEPGDKPKTVRIRCSQCDAMVINGIPCHELGCPNRKHNSK